MSRRGADAPEGAGDRPEAGEGTLFPRHGVQDTGRYDEALVELRAAAAQYPRDRVVLDQIGRVLFLQRKFSDAVKAFEQVLSVDPEDLQAHYNLMCAIRAGRRRARGARTGALQRFKADESAQAITGPYRLKSPHDNNERQSIHEHRISRRARRERRRCALRRFSDARALR